MFSTMNLGRSKSVRSHRTRRHAWVYRQVESLEDRRVPATFSLSPLTADGAPGSLRDAIIQANANGQDDTINLQAGVYQLTVANTVESENAARQGDLDLTETGHSVTIQGADAATTAIDGGALDRVFQVFGGVIVTLRNLTVRHGLAHDSGIALGVPSTAYGGGILNSGSLTLDHVILENNTAGGLNGADGTPGLFSTAGKPGLTAAGGAIFNSGTLGIVQSILRKNAASGGKGGSGYATGATSVDRVGGDGGNGLGGAIWNNGTLNIQQSTIQDNAADGGFGGDGADNPHNDGFNAGNGGDSFGGGLYSSPNSGQVLIVDSTLAGNSAAGGLGGQGGAAGNLGNPLVNPGSTGGSGGKGGNGKGGGIASFSAIALDNSTIANNSTHGFQGGQGGPGGVGNPIGVPGNKGLNGSAEAGGVWAPTDPGMPGLISAISSLFAGNFNDTSSFPDVEATFVAPANDLVQNPDGAKGITDGVSGNILGKDPLLGPLQDNGGPVPTIALLAGSPAIDAGANPLNLSADGRGFTPRAANGKPDIGAFETMATAPPKSGGSGSGGGAAGGSGSSSSTGITVQIIKQKRRRRLLEVFDAATGALRFTVYPFGKGFSGNYNVTMQDVNHDGFVDVVASHKVARNKFLQRAFEGRSGTPLMISKS
jgi:hypothetical protein